MTTTTEIGEHRVGPPLGSRHAYNKGCRYEPCSAANAQHVRAYQTEHPEKVAAYNKTARKSGYRNRWMKQRRAEQTAIWREKHGRVCLHCGTDQDLTFDHIDPNTKLEEPNNVLASWPVDRIASELDKCQILCRSCHGTKSNAERAA